MQTKEQIAQANRESIFVASDFSHIAPINPVRRTCPSWTNYSRSCALCAACIISWHIVSFCRSMKRHLRIMQAMAVVRNQCWTVAPSDSAVLNMNGLSTQVQAQWSFFSDGPYRSFSFGNITIEFKHCGFKETSGMTAEELTGLDMDTNLGK